MTDLEALLAARGHHHLLTNPAATVTEAARHMAATQAQELWGGKFALAARTAHLASSREVDRAFDDGHLVRTWPMRGTLHIICAEDVAWMLSVSADRVFRSAAGRHRELGLDADDFARAERLWRQALKHSPLSRADALAVLRADGLDTAGQRAAHLILALALRGVVHWGASEPRADGAPATAQLLTLNDDLPANPVPADPAAELARRYVAGHAPANIRDFAWWSGLPITQARRAMRAAADDDGLEDETLLVPTTGGVVRWDGSAHGAPASALLPTFEEYYISYADRSPVATQSARDAVGPGRNGMVRAIVLRDGRIAAAWTRAGEVEYLNPARSVGDADLTPWNQHRDGT